MEQHLDLFADLAAPFEHDEVRVRPQGGRQLQYVTARTVMNRLDDVLGPSNWWDEYSPQQNSVICRLTIRLPDGTTLTKCDAGGYAGMQDSGDDDKSGFSDAFKRAAVKFGIGRYLYRDGMPRFVREHGHQPASGGERLAHPTTHPLAAHPVQTPASAPSVRPASDGHVLPQTGKALFAWIKQHDEKHDSGLLRRISDWAKRQDFPARMIQWDAEQVHKAFAEAQNAIQTAAGATVPGPGSAPPTASVEPANGTDPSTAAPRGGSSRREREASQPRSGRSR